MLKTLVIPQSVSVTDSPPPSVSRLLGLLLCGPMGGTLLQVLLSHSFTSSHDWWRKKTQNLWLKQPVRACEAELLLNRAPLIWVKPSCKEQTNKKNNKTKKQTWRLNREHLNAKVFMQGQFSLLLNSSLLVCSNLTRSAGLHPKQ